MGGLEVPAGAGQGSEDGHRGANTGQGAVRKEWGFFPDFSEEEKGFLKFWDQGMVGKGKRVRQLSSGWFCSRIPPSMRFVLFELLCSQYEVQ